jgi:hypothetical protein
MTRSSHLDQSYRYALCVMVVGWLIALSVYGLSWLHAWMAMKAATAQAQGIWVNPQGVDPAALPEPVRLALLSIIQSKRQYPPPKNGLSVELSPEESRRLLSMPQSPQMTLVRQFVQVGHTLSSFRLDMFSPPAPVRRESPPIIVMTDDSWSWLRETNSRITGSDEPGDWWFIDPATGQRTYRDLSDIESEMAWENLSATIAFIFSLPWLWYFLLTQLDDGLRDEG